MHQVVLEGLPQQVELPDQLELLTMHLTTTIIWHFIHTQPIQARDIQDMAQELLERRPNYLPTHRQLETRLYTI